MPGKWRKPILTNLFLFFFKLNGTLSLWLSDASLTAGSNLKSSRSTAPPFVWAIRSEDQRARSVGAGPTPWSARSYHIAICRTSREISKHQTTRRFDVAGTCAHANLLSLDRAAGGPPPGGSGKWIPLSLSFFFFTLKNIKQTLQGRIHGKCQKEEGWWPTAGPSLCIIIQLCIGLGLSLKMGFTNFFPLSSDTNKVTWIAIYNHTN